MTQNDRFLRALRNGPVNSTDFLAPNVLDGGKPITRASARVYDLRHDYGCEITEDREANGTSTYTLVRGGVERHDSEPTREAHGDQRSQLGVVSLGTPAQASGGSAPAPLLPSEATPLFDWPAVAA